mgnify:CR=1 FL=1
MKEEILKNELTNLINLRRNILSFKKSINTYSSTLEKTLDKQSKPRYKERCKHEIKTLDQVCEKTVNIKQSFNDMIKKFKSDDFKKRNFKWG